MIDMLNGVSSIPRNQHIPKDKTTERKNNLMTSYGQQLVLWGSDAYRTESRSATKVQLETMEELLDCLFCDRKGNGEDINRNNIK